MEQFKVTVGMRKGQPIKYKASPGRCLVVESRMKSNRLTEAVRVKSKVNS